MALGIGATTAIYSVIDATLLHPLPYPNPAELVRIVDDLPGVGAQGVDISVPEWRDFANSGIFQSAAITDTGANVNLTGSAQPCVSASSRLRPITSQSSVSMRSWAALSIHTMPLPDTTWRS